MQCGKYSRFDTPVTLFCFCRNEKQGHTESMSTYGRNVVLKGVPSGVKLVFIFIVIFD